MKVNSTVRVDFVARGRRHDRDGRGRGRRRRSCRRTAPTPAGRSRAGRSRTCPSARAATSRACGPRCPGTVTLTRPHSQFFNPQDSQETKFNGQSRLSNNVQIDGLDDNHKTGLLTVLIPSAESIDSVNVTTSNFDAEFGRAGGSVTTVVLKSGTNQFKGQPLRASGTARRRRPGASSPSPTSVKPETKYQQFGATLGGPIIKDKLFFFTDYQRTVDNLGQLRRVVIPPTRVAQRRLLDGEDDHLRPRHRQPGRYGPHAVPRQHHPGQPHQPRRPEHPRPDARSRTSPARPSARSTTSWRRSEREKTTNAFNVKLNYNPTAQRPAFAALQLPAAGDLRPRHLRRARRRRRRLRRAPATRTPTAPALTWTRTLSPSLIMEWRAGYSKYHNEALSPRATGLDSSTEVGIPGANYDEFSSGISRISIEQRLHRTRWSASRPACPGTAARRPSASSGMLTKVAGNHTMKVGTEVRHNEDFLLQIQDAGGVRGQFSFNGARTAIPTDSAAPERPRQRLGVVPARRSRPRSSATSRSSTEPGTKHWAVFAFAQDKWQVTPKLTVDLGLRWEYYTPLVGIADQGGLSNYDPVEQHGAQVAGYGSVPQNIGVKSTWTNFAPRLGASYRFNEKTVLRAGFGTTIVPFPDNRYAYNFPVKQTNQFNAPNSFAPAGTMAAGFGPPDFFAIPPSGVVDASIPQLRNAQLFYVQPDLKEAKLHSWNVAFQRQLPWNLVAEVAYVGNVGRGIVLPDYNINAGLTLGADNAGRPYYQKYGRTANVLCVAPHGHLLQLAAGQARPALPERLPGDDLVHPRPGDQLLGGDRTSTRRPTSSAARAAPTSTARTRSRRASSGTCRSSRSADGVLHWVLGGWQVSGIFTAYSGTPGRLHRFRRHPARAPDNTQRPNLNGGDPEVFGDIGPGQQYFDTSVFSAPGAEHVGQHEAQRLDRRPRLLESRPVAREAVPLRQPGHRRAARGRLQRVQPPGTSTTRTAPSAIATFGQVTGMAGAYSARLVRFGARVIF